MLYIPREIVNPRPILSCRAFIYWFGFLPWGVVCLVLSPQTNQGWFLTHLAQQHPQVSTGPCKAPLTSQPTVPRPGRWAPSGLARVWELRSGQTEPAQLKLSELGTQAAGRRWEREVCLCFPGECEQLLESEGAEQKHGLGWWLRGILCEGLWSRSWEEGFKFRRLIEKVLPGKNGKKKGNGRCGTGKGKKINKERLILNPKDLHPLEGCSDSLPSPRLLLLPEKELWSVSYVSRVGATGEQGPHTPTLRPWLKAASGYELTSTSFGQIAPVAQG